MADVIKEFLVSLGFKVDDQSFKKFQSGVGDADKATTGFGEGLEGLATKLSTVSLAVAASAAGIVAAVTEIASGLDKLYFQARNTGATATEIKGLEYAFTQLGASAGTATAAIDALASIRRHLGTGADSALLNLGVTPEHLQDSAAALVDLEKTFQKMVASGSNGQARAFSFGKMLGLSDDAMIVMLRDTGEGLAQYKALIEQSGFSMDQAARDGQEYSSAMRSLGVQFDLIKVELASALIPFIEKAARAVLQFVNAWQTGGTLSGISGDVLELVHNIVLLNKTMKDLSGLSENSITGFLSNSIHAIGDLYAAVSHVLQTLDDLAHFDLKQARVDNVAAGVAIYNLIGDGAKVIGSPGGAGSDMPRLADPSVAAGARPGPATGAMADLFRRSGVADPQALGGGSYGGNGGGGGSDGGNGGGGGRGGGGNGGGGGRGGGGGLAVGLDGGFISRAIRAAGYTAEQTKGILAGIGAEHGGLGMSANGAFGIGQWRGSRQAALFARYHTNTPNLAQQVAFLISELQGGDRGGASVGWQTGANDTMIAYLRDFMRPQGAHGEHMRDLIADINRGSHILGGGGARTNFTQTNNNHFHGGDPHATAVAVGQAQHRANQRLFANLAPLAQ